MFNKKSIVLNGVEDEFQKGILSIEENDEVVFGNIRLYNFDQEPDGIISLGIYDDEKVAKAGLTRTGDMLFSFKSELKKIPKHFSCAVVNFSGGEPKPILYGNSSGYLQRDLIFDEVISKLKTADTTSKIEKVLDEYNIDFFDEERKEIDEEIDKNITKEDIQMMCEKDCENCQYKKYYLSQTNSLNIQDENKEDTSQSQLNFYEEMKDHIDKLFENNPHEDYLQNLLPNSKFVKVMLEENNYYVLGLIYDDDEIKYICYGVPGIYQKNPPRQLGGIPVWFPIDTEKPDGFGYWLSYQDAVTGQSVKALIV